MPGGSGNRPSGRSGRSTSSRKWPGSPATRMRYPGRRRSSPTCATTGKSSPQDGRESHATAGTSRHLPETMENDDDHRRGGCVPGRCGETAVGHRGVEPGLGGRHHLPAHLLDFSHRRPLTARHRLGDRRAHARRPGRGRPEDGDHPPWGAARTGHFPLRSGDPRRIQSVVYTSAEYRALVAGLGMRSSMGRTGVCWDCDTISSSGVIAV